MNASERIEAVRLSLEILELRRKRCLTKEQATALIEELGLRTDVLDPIDGPQVIAKPLPTGPVTPRPAPPDMVNRG